MNNIISYHLVFKFEHIAPFQYSDEHSTPFFI